MAGRSPSPPARRRPSPPLRRSRQDSRSPSRDRYRSRRTSRSPPRRDQRKRSYSPSRRYGGSQREIEGFPILPGETFSDYRTRVRGESTKTIWAPSPSRPTRSPTPEDTRQSKKKRSKKYDTESEEDSSDEEERRRRRRHKKKKSSRHHKSSRHSSSRKSKRRYSDESDDSDTDSKAKRSHKKDDTVLEVNKSHIDAVEDLWVEKKVDLPDDLAPVGPTPLVDNDSHDARAYGGALLPGEGSAMAAYVQQGKRIPRRGEIGLSGDQILDFEKSGYVMSGSRHQRMNAVRLRKENQVISAEEKRLVLQHAQEQKIKRENEIISGFREILSDKFKKDE